ncbi:TPA: accessory Sec system protein Asp2 [Streptococcus suis]|nr:accessory Sec system protein Asp2 [Streptococcus suis]
MKILQIGSQDWSQGKELPADLEWLYTSAEGITDLLQELNDAALAKTPAEKLAEMGENPKVPLYFTGILVTDSLSEKQLEPLMNNIEAYAVFMTENVEVFDIAPTGFYRRKVMSYLPIQGSQEELIAFLHMNLFSGQYGAKLKIPEIDVNPNFTGQVDYEGNVGVTFTGDFGENFQPLMTFRYNLGTFPMSLEIWLEYIKNGDCELRLELDLIRKGSLADVFEKQILSEEEMKEPYVLAPHPEVGFYSVSVSARGTGSIKTGVLHWRYSRSGLGRFVLGGKRHSDAKRQEIFHYFNPGDMKPPLNVYFSGFRGAEGFEGFFMMKRLGAPFLLVADPRLEGGCFYSGTDELEEGVQKAIEDALDYLGFEKQQLILSGLSMGAFGGLYYSSYFNPHAVIVGKPFTNLGETVSNLKLKRPGEFETSGDMIRNVVGGADSASVEAFNQRFWDKFGESDFHTTQFAIAYMEQDDYDGHAMERLIDYLADKDVHIFCKGYEGRHNDNSRAINRWFMAQYHKILKNDFGRDM